MGSPAEPGPLDAHGDPPTSASGIPLRDFYRPSRDAQAIYEDRIGDPGSFPFTRGKYRSGYSSELWIARNLAGTQSAVHTNERLRFLIAQGQTGLAIVPDTATQSGLDYDHPWGEPLVGLQGVPLACVDDMAAMCDGIDLKSINASFSTFQTPVAAQYVVPKRSAWLDSERPNLCADYWLRSRESARRHATHGYRLDRLLLSELA
jgi:methylmalonyl-CoA mutase N-terminal domain/subunit